MAQGSGGHPNDTSPRLIGGLHPRQEATRGPRGQEADPPGVVATLRVDRGLKSGKLDKVTLDEVELARVVEDGAAILASLAKRRSRPSLEAEAAG